MKPEDFILELVVPAKVVAGKTGIPVSFTIAQAALESAWGESKLAKAGKNLFGVKADKSWTGPVVLMPTREFIDGKWITIDAGWREYEDWQECLDDHSRFLMNNKRYKVAFSHTDGPGFADEVARAGYATDPDYAKKIKQIISAHNLEALNMPLEV